MASTNSTTNYELSQFIGSDSPKWLTDYNGDMEKIDAGIAAVKTQADATDLIVSGHTTTIGNINTTVGEQSSSITTLRTDVNTNTGSINTINSLIGNGTPTTTDQTIIGAINEINADLGTAETTISTLSTNVSNIQTALSKLTPDVYVTSDGTKSNSDLLNELHALIDFTKITKNSKLVSYRDTTSVDIYSATHISSDSVSFGASIPTSEVLRSRTFNVASSGSSQFAMLVADMTNPTVSAVRENAIVISAGLNIGIVY